MPFQELDTETVSELNPSRRQAVDEVGELRRWRD